MRRNSRWWIALGTLFLTSLTFPAWSKNTQTNTHADAAEWSTCPSAQVAPASGAALAQPITLDWNTVSVAGGPIG